MPGKFEVYRDKRGEFRFRLKAANGQNILSSEGYSSKASCLNAIESVKKNSQNPDRFVKKTTASGKFRFNLIASNGQVIGTSQTYKSSSTADRGLLAVRKNSKTAGILDYAQGGTGSTGPKSTR